MIAFPALRFAPLSLLVWLAVAIALFGLPSCQSHYEPPGQDIWRAL
jgi:hypothetical protein